MERIVTQILNLWAVIVFKLTPYFKPLTTYNAYRRYKKVYKAFKKLDKQGLETNIFRDHRMMTYAEYKKNSVFPNYSLPANSGTIPLMGFYRSYSILAKYKYLNKDGSIPNELGIEINIPRSRVEVTLPAMRLLGRKLHPEEKDFYSELISKDSIVQTWTDLESDITTRMPIIDTEQTEKLQSTSLTKVQ